MEGEAAEEKPKVTETGDGDKGGGSNPPHRFSVENQRAYRERITALHERLDKLVPKPRNTKRRKKRSRIHLLEDLRVLLQSLYSDDKMLPLLRGAVARQKGEAPPMPSEAQVPQQPPLQNMPGKPDNNAFSSITQRMLLGQNPQLQGMDNQQFASGMAALQNSMQSQGLQRMPDLPPNMAGAPHMMMPDFGTNLMGQQLQAASYMQMQQPAMQYGMDRIATFDPAAQMGMAMPGMGMDMNKLMQQKAQAQGYPGMPQYAAPAVAMRLGGQQGEEVVSQDPGLMVTSTAMASSQAAAGMGAPGSQQVGMQGGQGPQGKEDGGWSFQVEGSGGPGGGGQKWEGGPGGEGGMAPGGGPNAFAVANATAGMAGAR